MVTERVTDEYLDTVTWPMLRRAFRAAEQGLNAMNTPAAKRTLQVMRDCIDGANDEPVEVSTANGS